MSKIERSAGYNTGYGYIAGGGYEGKTKALDNAVKKAAEFMEKEFDRDIEIRFNSDRESGGAWLKDNKGSTDLGLGANLRNVYPKGMDLESYLKSKGLDWIKDPSWKIREAEKELPKKIVYDVGAEIKLLKTGYKIKTKHWDHGNSTYIDFSTMKAAQNWIKHNVDYLKVKNEKRMKVKV